VDEFTVVESENVKNRENLVLEKLNAPLKSSGYSILKMHVLGGEKNGEIPKGNRE
jgi:hypothetical protein